MSYLFSFRRYRLPFRHPVRTAHGLWSERDGMFLRIENSRGELGFGEAAPLSRFGTETIDEIVAACGDIAARADDARLASVPARLSCLKHAIAAALEQLSENARRNEAAEGRSVTGPAVENGRQAVGESPAYLAMAALLPAGRVVLSAIEPKAEMGFRVFKWKVGTADVGDELALLDDVCARLPEGAKLRLDANGAWNRRQAERWLERCAERPVEFVEQPIARDTRGIDDLLTGLAEDYPTPLALDESLVGDGDVERWIGLGWRGVFVVKPSLLADVAGALAKLENAKATVVFSSALETALGARAALNHAFAWRGERRALGFGVWPLFADGRFDGPMAMPFVRKDDVDRIDPEAVWNALS